MKQIIKIIVPLLSGLVIFCGAVVFVALAWTEPVSMPPAGNVGAPVNTGPTAQIKLGALGFGDANLVNGNAPYYIKESGGNFQLIPNNPANSPALVFDRAGNVGVGATPVFDASRSGKQLNVNGFVNGQAGLCIGGSCCTQWEGCFQIPLKHISRTCPAADSCGLNIVLVMDSSSSIGGALNENMKPAFKNFVKTLSATPSEFSMVNFNTKATILQPFTGKIDLINAAINKPISTGSTNWQDALIKAEKTLESLNSNRRNLVVFASDGAPNTCGESVGPARSIRGINQHCENAFDLARIEADKIKNSGTQIIALGLGKELTKKDNIDKLVAIASPDSYYPATDYEKLAGVLNGIAGKLCGGTINVHKIIDADGNLATTGDQTNVESAELSSWLFNIAGEPNKITDKNGRTDSVCVISNEGPFSVTEESTNLKSHYNFDGAVCTGSSNSNGKLLGDQRKVSNIFVGNKDIVSCTFYNSPIGECAVNTHISCSENADFKCFCPSGKTCIDGSCK